MASLISLLTLGADAATMANTATISREVAVTNALIAQQTQLEAAEAAAELEEGQLQLMAMLATMTDEQKLAWAKMVKQHQEEKARQAKIDAENRRLARMREMAAKALLISAGLIGLMYLVH